MDRREFIKSAGIGAAAISAAACAPQSVKHASAKSTHKGDPTGTMKQNYPGVGLLGYGCMRWKMIKDADGKNIIDQDDVNRLVDYAIAHGVNYFDSAPVYLKGQSEEATAKALLRHPREDYLIATKCSNFGMSSFQSGVDMYHQSLQYYQTDHIDYYLLHSISGEKAFNTRFLDNGLVDYFASERDKGHIRNLGFSFHGDKAGFDYLLSFHEKYHWDFVQIQMNYVDWIDGADYLYEELDKREIPVVIMEPLLGGSLSKVPASIVDEFKARRPEDSVASWAFRFVGSYPRVLTVLSGMTYMSHLKDNLFTYLDFDPCTDEEIGFLKEMAVKIKNFPLIGCTGCNYCMPCPYGIDIPGIFAFYNTNINEDTYVLNKEQKDYAKARRKYLLQYDNAIETVRQADHCINCRQCESKCPQHLRIPSELQRIDKYIESLKQETI